MAAEGFRPSSYRDFEPSAFLKRYFTKTSGISYAVDRMQHTLRCYHDAIEKLPNGLKVLDYGSGPVIFGAISAATKASEIVLSDVSEKNCEALRTWLNGDSGAFDWSPHFKFVVCELEGKSEKEAEEREDQVRKLVKAVVHCDISKDPPIEKGYNCVYDVVISSIAVESAASTVSEYVTYLSRLGTLVKPRGLLMLYTIENKTGIYQVGDHYFCNLPIKAEFSVQTLKEAGFVDLSVDRFFPDDPNRIFSFVKGTRARGF